MERGEFGERPSGCVCKAKRPAVGAHLLTISPWRVALRTRTHTHWTHTFPGYGAQMRNDNFTLGWSCKMLHQDNRAVSVKQNVKNY